MTRVAYGAPDPERGCELLSREGMPLLRLLRAAKLDGVGVPQSERSS